MLSYSLTIVQRWSYDIFFRFRTPNAAAQQYLKSVLQDLKSHQNCGKAFRQLLESDWLRSLHNRRSKLHQQAGLERTRFFLNPAQWFFLVFFWVFCVFLFFFVFFSVADPDPPDPHVFGPPKSGSTSQRYGSGSGSFYHHTKIGRKTLIPTIL